METHLISKDGTRTPYYFTGLRMVLDEKICLIGVWVDIAERKRTEEALKESDLRFRTFSEKTPLGISFIDVDGRYEYVNPAFVSIFGWDLSDISSGQDWFKLAYPDPDNRSQVFAAWKEDLLKYIEGEVRIREYEVMSKDGTKKPSFSGRSLYLPASNLLSMKTSPIGSSQRRRWRRVKKSLDVSWSTVPYMSSLKMRISGRCA